MKSVGDQLKDIGLIDSQKLGQSDSPKWRKQGPSRNSDTTSKLILELPLLGQVTRIEEGRGFGFVAIDGGGEDLFFHLKGYAGRRAGAESLPPPNTPLLLITGSDRRRRTGREAVRWYPLIEVPVLADEPAIDQKMYDVLRRDRLHSMTTDGLWRLLRAEWYCRQWENDAPADLDDPALEAVWKARLREIDDNHLADGTFWDRLSHCRYEFAARLLIGPHRVVQFDC